jgi:hypothetical protein
MGEPLPLDDEALDGLAQVTPADIAAAQQWWRRNAPARFKGLLDARPDEDDDDHFGNAPPGKTRA